MGGGVVYDGHGLTGSIGGRCDGALGPSVPFALALGVPRRPNRSLGLASHRRHTHRLHHEYGDVRKSGTLGRGVRGEGGCGQCHTCCGRRARHATPHPSPIDCRYVVNSTVWRREFEESLKLIPAAKLVVSSEPVNARRRRDLGDALSIPTARAQPRMFDWLPAPAPTPCRSG